jgi:hypothetical protein
MVGSLQPSPEEDKKSKREDASGFLVPALVMLVAIKILKPGFNHLESVGQAV